MPVPPVARGIVPAIVPGMMTVKGRSLLGWFETLTTTGPLVAVDGTGVTMLTFVQFVGVAVKPLNVMTPGVVPKSDPAMVTTSARWAIAGVADVRVGGGMTVNV